MTDLFDAEDAPKPARAARRGRVEDAPASPGAAAEPPAVAAPTPDPEPAPAPYAAERAEAAAEAACEIADDVAREENRERILNDVQRQTLSKIVDYRFNVFQRHKADASEVRRVLLELVANL